jgi:hypothetical protein
VPNRHVTIEPLRGWAPLGLRELWICRELLYFFVWPDVKIRYKQTILGAAWAVLQPLLTHQGGLRLPTMGGVFAIYVVMHSPLRGM